MKDYKCIIFDCDGVLVDSEPLANLILVEMANELGATIDLNYAYSHFKGDSFANCQARIQKLLDHPLPSNFETEYRRRSFEKFTEELKPISGIKDLLQDLKIPFCVASSGPQNKIRHNLGLTGLLPYFDQNIFSCHDINKWKPEPDIFLHAAKSMGFGIDQCLVIEDTLIGITAAERGGFDVFGFADKFNKDRMEMQTNATFQSIEQLRGLLHDYLTI